MMHKEIGVVLTILPAFVLTLSVISSMNWLVWGIGAFVFAVGLALMLLGDKSSQKQVLNTA